MFDARRLLDRVTGALPPEVRQGQATGGGGQLLIGALAFDAGPAGQIQDAVRAAADG